jgi:hypothetical protein
MSLQHFILLAFIALATAGVLAAGTSALQYPVCDRGE